MDIITKEKLDAYIELAHEFSKHGYSLYMVGGTVRDYLLNIPLTDLDVVSDATPEEIKTFFPNGDYTFSRFGSVKLHYKNYKFDITTLRIEEGYEDYRHPGKIKFVKSLELDVKRRDFTINALYMDSSLNVIDYVNGQEDLKNKVIRMLGDASKRIVEDPLRIIRAIRFRDNLDFNLDESLLLAIKEHKDLVKKLNENKIDLEIRKSTDKEKLMKYLKDLEVL